MKENITPEILELIKEHIIELLENSINETKRVNKLTARTKSLRPEYSANNGKNKMRVAEIIETIRQLRKNENLSKEERTYAVELENQATVAIYRLLMGKSNRQEKMTLEEWQMMIDQLIQKQGENGKTVNADQVLGEIREGLFFQYIKTENTFFSQFQYGKNRKAMDENVEGGTENFCQIIELCNSNIEETQAKIKKLTGHRKQILNQYMEKINEEGIFNTSPEWFLSCMVSEYQDKGAFAYFDAFKIGLYTLCKGVKAGHIWGLENWGRFSIRLISHDLWKGENYLQINRYSTNIPDSKLGWSDAYFRKEIIEKQMFAEKHMEQWLLVPLLEQLTADAMSFEEMDSVYTRKKCKYCEDVEEIRGSDIFEKTNIFHYARKKQVDKPSSLSSSEDVAFGYWTVYRFQKPALFYMAGNETEEDDILKTLRCKRKNSKFSSFSCVKNYFEKIDDEQDQDNSRYFTRYYLNQYIKVDIAVELCYGMERLFCLSSQGGKNAFEGILEEVKKLAKTAAFLHRNLKCGVGSMLHECFKEKIKESGNLKNSTLEEKKQFLREVTALLESYLTSNDVGYMQRRFYEEVLKSSWIKIQKTFSPIGVRFDQNFFSDLEILKRRKIIGKEAHERIKKALYEDNIEKILYVISENKANDMQKQLDISKDAWQWAVENLHQISKRSKFYFIYNIVQETILETNFEN